MIPQCLENITSHDFTASYPMIRFISMFELWIRGKSKIWLIMYVLGDSFHANATTILDFILSL